MARNGGCAYLPAGHRSPRIQAATSALMRCNPYVTAPAECLSLTPSDVHHALVTLACRNVRLITEQLYCGRGVLMRMSIAMARLSLHCARDPIFCYHV